MHKNALFINCLQKNIDLFIFQTYLARKRAANYTTTQAICQEIKCKQFMNFYFRYKKSPCTFVQGDECKYFMTIMLRAVSVKGSPLHLIT